MFIDIRELAKDRLEFHERIPAGRIDLGADIMRIAPLDTEGSAELTGDDISLQGHLSTTVEVMCARCLEPIREPIERDFDLLYRPMKAIAKEEEVEIAAAELEVGFYQGRGLQLEDALKEQILLALPMRSLCRPDCRGLCPQCGQDRNRAECGCRQEDGDSRWAPLAGLKK
jgi:DUF177 domain-containing protein